jgi:signal transduction histidine kinase
MALLMVGLIAAVGMVFVIIILIPPPQFPVYRLSEVASALRGDRTRLIDGRMLIRSAASARPADQPKDERSQAMQRLLADQLKVPVASVRLIQPAPPQFVRRRPRPPPGDRGGGFAQYPRAAGEWPRRPGTAAEGPPLFGPFTAALRLADGQWVTVRPPAERFPTDWQVRLMLWLGGCLAVTAPAAYLFGRRITAPIARFAEAAERLGRDPRQPAMPLSGPAEIGKAAAAFNRMQERIGRYVDDRTAMVGAISHDLRTPLARIRFRIERAEPELRTAVGLDLDRMEAMIAAVLAFIRDASEPSRRERLDLRSLVECVVDEAALMGEDVVIVGQPPSYTVEAEEAALVRLFSNVVGNAVKYAGGAEIRFQDEDDGVAVLISDEGPGVPADDLERVFQPFYRADAARTLTDDGVGLGLAVARSIARAHGGDLSLEARSPRGVTARVTLPLAAPHNAPSRHKHAGA